MCVLSGNPFATPRSAFHSLHSCCHSTQWKPCVSGSYQPPKMAVNTMYSIHRVLPRPLPPNTSIPLLPHQPVPLPPPNPKILSNHHSGSTIFATSYLGRPSFPVNLHHLLVHLLPKADAQHLPPCRRVAGSTEPVQHFASLLNHTSTLFSKLPITPSACSMSLAVVCSMAPRLPRLLAEVSCFRAGQHFRLATPLTMSIALAD